VYYLIFRVGWVRLIINKGREKLKLIEERRARNKQTRIKSKEQIKRKLNSALQI